MNTTVDVTTIKNDIDYSFWQQPFPQNWINKQMFVVGRIFEQYIYIWTLGVWINWSQIAHSLRPWNHQNSSSFFPKHTSITISYRCYFTKKIHSAKIFFEGATLSIHLIICLSKYKNSNGTRYSIWNCQSFFNFLSTLYSFKYIDYSSYELFNHTLIDLFFVFNCTVILLSGYTARRSIFKSFDRRWHHRYLWKCDNNYVWFIAGFSYWISV